MPPEIECFHSTIYEKGSTGWTCHGYLRTLVSYIWRRKHRTPPQQLTTTKREVNFSLRLVINGTTTKRLDIYRKVLNVVGFYDGLHKYPPRSETSFWVRHGRSFSQTPLRFMKLPEKWNMETLAPGSIAESYAFRACVLCRARKGKCDRFLPACTQCVRYAQPAKILSVCPVTSM